MLSGTVRIFVVASVLIPAPAHAHHPMGGTTPSTFMEGLLSGLGHPLIGIDHFLFIAAAGVLAARLERGWILPLVFVLASVLATLARYLGADAGLGELPVAASLVVLGAMLLGSTPPSRPEESNATPRRGVVALLFLLAGAIHGHALGEAIVGAEQTPLAAYLAGLAIIQCATGLCAWRAAVWLAARRPGLPVQKAAGAMAGIAGLVFGAMATMPEAGAQAWRPEKPVELVVPTGAGGINDQITRLVQKVLQDDKLIAVPALVMNKPGGNQSLSVIYMSQRAPDPHYLMYSTATLFTNQLAGLTELGYKDFTPVALLVEDFSVITVGANSPLKGLRDLVEQLKSDPGSVSFGMVSRGGPNHLALSQAMRSAGVDVKQLRIVVFKTNAQSMTAAMGGHIHAVVSSVSAALPQAQAGNTRMIAVAAPRRIPGPLAGLPTMREQGVDATGISNWRAIFATKGVTPAQLAFWDESLAKVTASEEWKKDIDATNMTPHYLRSAAFAKFLDAEYASTRAVMSDLGLIKQ